ncbi:MAG: exo-alpha-sialidase [Verrucomicrobiaceae bacterium]
MKHLPHLIFILAMLIHHATHAQITGGFSNITPTDPEVQAAAKFAVNAHDAKLTLKEVEKAETQVVAGTNYKMGLRLGDGRRVAVVVWRKLDGSHELISWQTLDTAAPQPGLVKSEFIFDPNPVPSCHATTIVETKNGTLVSAWFAGTAESKPDVCIWSSRSADGAWTAPVKVAEGTPHPCWNPVLFQPREGDLMLFYKVGPSPSTWWGMLKTSSDGGKTWSEAVKLPDGILGPIKNKPVQLADGTILCGSSAEGLTPPPTWQIHFERSTDNGKTWMLINVPQPETAPASIQPSILLLGGDRLMSLGRTRAGKIFHTTSEDNGLTWTQTALLDLPNPNSGTDAVTLKDGRHLLIYNHTAKGRSPLNLALSKDGKIWEAALVLENEPKMEFSYPAIIQTSDGLVHATYTWKRKLVKHAVIDPAKLATKPIVNGEWPQ